MTDARRILLQKYLQGKPSVAPASSRTITRRVPNAPATVSFSQERLWVLDQLLPGSSVFNVPMAVRLHVPIDELVLEDSINEIIRRHEILRTTFVTENGFPVPVVSPNLKIRLTVNDLSNLSAAEAETKGKSLSRVAAEHPFDLLQGPLIRASLIRFNPSDQIAN